VNGCAIPFFGAGLIVIAVALRNIQLARRSTRWPAAAGRIDDTAVRVVGDRAPSVVIEGVVFTPPLRYWQDVLYRYEVNGRCYTGSRKYFGWRKRTALDPERVSAEYVPATEVLVRYDPADPSRAVIEPGVNLSLVVELMIGATLVGIGLWIIVAWS
jgi:hypothetical protein